jgi:uncharacterized protein (DUF433 family)
LVLDPSVLGPSIYVLVDTVALGMGRKELMSFTRITVRPDQMGGAPCVRDLRIPVAAVVDMVAEDVREAVRYAAEAVRERELPLAASGWGSWWMKSCTPRP